VCCVYVGEGRGGKGEGSHRYRGNFTSHVARMRVEVCDFDLSVLSGTFCNDYDQYIAC
jgi:hypothetical protein